MIYPFIKSVLREKAILLSLLLFPVAYFSYSQVEPAKEYQIKAAFIFNFTQFIAWPEGSFPESGSPFVLGVFGPNPFGTYLEQTVAGEKKEGHPMIVKYFHHLSEIVPCQLLFLVQPENTRALLQDVHLQAALTISDAPGFAASGGMIELNTLNNKIQFKINLKALKAANFTVSSKLLRLAEIVK